MKTIIEQFNQPVTEWGQSKAVPVLCTPISYRPITIMVNGERKLKSQAVKLFNVTSRDGSIIYNDCITQLYFQDNYKGFCKMTMHKTIDSFVEIPMRRISDKMQIEKHVGKGYSAIKNRLIDNHERQFLQCTHRYCAFIPAWFAKNVLVKKFKNITKLPVEDTFQNDDNFFGVAEQTAIDSYNMDYLEDRVETTHTEFDESQSLKQWELDNPEYQSFNW